MIKLLKQPSIWLKPFLSLLLILTMGLAFPASGLLAYAEDDVPDTTHVGSSLVNMELSQEPGGRIEWADGHVDAKRECELESPIEIKAIPDAGYHVMGLLVWNETYHDGNGTYMEPVSMTDLLNGTVDTFTVKARESVIYPIFVKDEDLTKTYTFSLTAGEHGNAYIEGGGTEKEFAPGDRVVFFTEPDEDYFPDHVFLDFDESKAALRSMDYSTPDKTWIRWEFDMPATDVSAKANFTEMIDSLSFKEYQVLNGMMPEPALSAADFVVGNEYTLGTVTLNILPGPSGGGHWHIPGTGGSDTMTGFSFGGFQGTDIFAGAAVSYQPGIVGCSDCGMGHTPTGLVFWCNNHNAAATSYTGTIVGTCTENQDGRAVFRGQVIHPQAASNYQSAVFAVFAVHYGPPSEPDPPAPTPTPTPEPTPEPGDVRFRKVSDSPSCTDGNSAYDLTGATYGIYTSSSCSSSSRVDTVRVISNTGYTQWSDDLEPGLYYVKETSKANKGYGLNTNKMSFRIREGGHDTITLSGNMAEPALNDPTAIVVQKSFSNQTVAGKPQGNVSSFAGIKFRFDYYNDIYSSVSAAQASGRPTASAIFATVDIGGKGFLRFDDAIPVDGTSWPYKAAGKNTFPLGTVVITEVSALDGMIVKGDPKAFTVIDKGGVADIKPLLGWPTQSVSGGAIGAFDNEIYMGNVTVSKADADEHKSNAQGDASLAGIQYQIVNKSANPVMINGTEVAVDGVCATIMTNASGVASFSNLPYGTYSITESNANEGYNKASWSKTFSITENGQTIAFNTPSTWNEDSVKRGSIEITKADADTGVSKPQGDGDLANTHYDVYNRSAQKVYVNGAWYAKDAKIATISTTWNAAQNAYVAQIRNLPYGTYEIRESAPPTGYLITNYSKTVQIRSDGQVIQLKDAATGYNTDRVMRGGVTVYKADADEHAQNPQGDGSLDGVSYQIVNQSVNPVMINGQSVPTGGVCATITTSTANGITSASFTGLPYGSYSITEINGNASYNKANWTKTFTIRQDGQTVVFNQANGWNEDQVKRGSIEITKADFDTGLSKPQGDAALEHTKYDIYNRSAQKVYVNGSWYAKNAKIATIQTEWNVGQNAYVARIDSLPYGTYEVVEAAPPEGYLKAEYSKTVQIREDGQVVQLKDASSGYNTDTVMRGGVSITKADEDWHESAPQGDATLEGVEYQIINRSKNAVFMKDTNCSYEPGEVITTLVTRWNEATQSYMVATDDHYLPYGTYEIAEVKSSTGYHNAEWHATFTIRHDGEMHYFDAATEGTSSDQESHHVWNENAVKRGGIIVGKIDRETGSYISLGEAHLEGATFEIINRSEHPVYVNGETHAVGATIMHIATEEMEWNGRTIYAATTGEQILPYGTYEVKEIASGTGYLFDSTSAAYTRTVEIRDAGQMIDLTNEADCAANQVLREDWHFQKKTQDTMERMDNIPFLVESLTTGEKHIIVTDENGMWGSDRSHTDKPNENDPTSPISNGAVEVAEDGSWVVVDSSKLNTDAGTWFTGVADDQVTWSADGKSYTVNGKTIAINNKLRAFPYDIYRVQELRCDNNVGYNLVRFTVTLHRYTADHDGPGLDLDYGTINDKYLSIGTTLTYGGVDKVVPANADVVLTDTVTYSSLDANKTYTLKGELHLVNEDGTDGGVVSTAEKSFNAGSGSGKVDVEFTLNTKEFEGKSLVAFEYLWENDQMIVDHEDIEDVDQTIVIPEIKTTLTGDLDHISNGGASEIVLTDTITYKNLEPGKTYVAHGTLMDKATGEALTDKDGNAITASTTFVPTAIDGQVKVVFKFSGIDTSGKTVVAFESVSKDDTEYAVHADIEDADQSVQFPEVDTFAVDASDGNKDLAEAANQEIRDVIRVDNLHADYDYKLVGELHIRNTDGSDGGVLMLDEDTPHTQEITWSGKDRSHEMRFTEIDARKLGGKDIVVYQTLYGKTGDQDWVVLGEHHDIDDADQSVHVPHIGTTMVTEQGIHESQVPEDGKITFVDTVAYENLTPGHEYVVVGTLHVQEISESGDITDGGAVKDGFQTVTAKTSFVAKEKTGTVDVTFTFDAKELNGKSITAFESLYSSPVKDVPDDWKEFFDDDDPEFNPEKPDDDWVVAEHEDIEDEGQTIYFAEIKTTLKSDAGLHTSQVPTGEDKQVSLTDTISYKNLIPGREYTMTGTLHVQKIAEDGTITDGGVLKDKDGKDVTATTTFIPMKPDGKVDVIFTFDASELEGQTVVAFEDVSTDDKTFATHTDITDESQSVHFVKLGTTALTEDETHEIQVPKDEDRQITITDIVRYENLIPGEEYTVSGTIHLQSVDNNGNLSDGGTIKDADGKDVVGSTTFTPEKPNGTVDVTFTFDAKELTGETLVVFETLYQKEKPVGVHHDITDEGQSIHMIDIGTTALAENGLHETQVPSGEDKTVTITDRVTYTNLIPGTEYKLSGTLHLQGVDSDGTITDKGELKDTRTEVTFTPETPNGFVDLVFTFDASDLEGQTVVAFEELSKKDVIVATHTDIEDEDQSVSFVDLHTTALAENGQHMTQIPVDDPIVTLIDTVAYKNLTPGKTYKVTGTLHIQDVDDEGKIVDGGVLKTTDPANSTEVTAETVFIPESPDGTVDVVFTFNASDLGGKTVVAFETLTQDDNVVGTHTDIEDENQSVQFVKIRTRALAENGEHEMILPEGENRDIKITDLVEYKNLIPGQEYKMTGEFHIQTVDANGVIQDGGVLKDTDGNPITAETTFKAKTPDGSVEVEFKIPAFLLQNKTIVAFETLTYQETIIAVHTDIEDEYQSVKFIPEEKPPVEQPPVEQPPEIVKTGQEVAYIVFIVLGVMILAGAGYLFLKKRR